jgi:SOS-response transcriptional repressor LexA
MKGDAMNNGLTRKQEAVLRYIFEETMRNGFQPTFLGIATHLGSPNRNAALCHIKALRLKGYLGGSTNESRALRLLKTPEGETFSGFVPRKEGRDDRC